MKHLFAVCMLTVISSQTLAQGLYLGGGVENIEFNSDYHTSTEMEIATVSLGYGFNRHIGIEAQASTGLTEGKWPYGTLGSCGPDNCRADTSVDSIVSAYVTGTLPLNNHLSFFGKAGYSITRGSIDVNFNNSDVKLDQDGLTFGAGINFRILTNTDIQFSFMKTNFSDNNEKMESLERLGIHLKYHF